MYMWLFQLNNENFPEDQMLQFDWIPQESGWEWLAWKLFFTAGITSL